MSERQHDDHCVIIYNHEPMRITRIRNGVFDLRGLHFCPGCQDFHEDFVKLSDHWCRSYAKERHHLICHYRQDESGEFAPLH